MASETEITEFTLNIEILVAQKKTSYTDAIILYCESLGMEPEVAAQLVSGSIKAKIKREAEELHLLPKPKSKKLPVKPSRT